MAGNLTFDQLKKAVAGGDIDTVLACAVDQQGRLIGKRFLAKFFVECGYEETHGCNYLLTTDVDMEPVPGYKAASWSQGYGDFVMKPDLSTLRNIPWLEKTALVLCDIQDHHTHDDLSHSPRAILKKQVARLKDRGYVAYFASELEFYLFNESYDSARGKHWQGLSTASPYIGDYLIGITTKEEDVMRRLAQRDGGRRHPDRELERRGRSRPGGDQRPLRRSRRHGRPARHPEERRQGDRRPDGQGDHLHGEVQLQPRRQFQPHPQFAVERRQEDAALPRQERAVGPVEDRPAMGRRADQIRPRIHRLPRALHQFLQAFPGCDLGADPHHLEPRQPHCRVSGSAAKAPRACAWSAASAAPT